MWTFLRNVLGFSQFFTSSKKQSPPPIPPKDPPFTQHLSNSFENKTGVTDARLYRACEWAWGLREFACYCLRCPFSHGTIAVCLLPGWRHLHWKCAHHSMLSHKPCVCIWKCAHHSMLSHKPCVCIWKCAHHSTLSHKPCVCIWKCARHSTLSHKPCVCISIDSFLSHNTGVNTFAAVSGWAPQRTQWEAERIQNEDNFQCGPDRAKCGQWCEAKNNVLQHTDQMCEPYKLFSHSKPFYKAILPVKAIL